MVRKPSLSVKCIHLVLTATERATIRVQATEKTPKAENGFYPKVKYTDDALYLQEAKALFGSLETPGNTHVLTRGHYQYHFRLAISKWAPPSYYCSIPTGATSKLQYSLTATVVVNGEVNPQTSLGGRHEERQHCGGTGPGDGRIRRGRR